MKKVNLFLMLSFFITLFSCDKNSVEADQVDKNELLTNSQIKEIGLKHNEALEYLFKNLSTEVKKPIGEVDEDINYHLENFYKANIIDEKDLSSAIKFSKKEVSNYFDKNLIKRTKSNNNSPLLQAIEDHKTNLSTNQITYLLECNNIITSSSDNVTVVVNKLNNLQEKAKKELSTKEAQLLLVSIEIGKNSVLYWEKNLDSWKEKYQQGTTKSWFSWGEVGGSDVAGAVGGAVGAVVVNVVPGLGQVAYGGAILGGGAGASAASAVKQLWDHF